MKVREFRCAAAEIMVRGGELREQETCFRRFSVDVHDRDEVSRCGSDRASINEEVAPSKSVFDPPHRIAGSVERLNDLDGNSLEIGYFLLGKYKITSVAQSKDV